MLRLLPAPIHGAFGLLALALNTIFWFVPLMFVALLRLITPLPSARRSLGRVLVRLAEAWIKVNNRLFVLAHRASWQVTGLEGLRRDRSYLICCNHNSWIDIPVLQRVFTDQTPFLRFFLKRELIWVPLLGLAWWALDFPFMRRHSPEYLARHPEKRGADLATVRKACERFRDAPTSILNFVEGTRFTEAKHSEQNSPFRHLLRPRAGGIASALAAMGEQFEALLDVTIIYPHGRVELGELLKGRLGPVIVHIERRPIPPAWLSGDYSSDEHFRAAFQQEIQVLWQEKDALIERALQRQSSPSSL